MAAARVLRRLAADEVDHAGPEGTGADLAGHQVRAVEAEGGGGRQDLALLAGGVVDIGLLVHRLERGEEAAILHEDLMRERHLQVLDEGAGGLRVLGDGGQRAGAEHRLAEVWHLGNGREVEEVGIGADLRAFREEGRDEGRLTVHVAFGRRREEALGAVAEVGRGNACRSAIHPGIILGELAEGFDCADDFGGIELDLVRHPLVVDFRRLCAQHHVFDPIGGRPAGGTARAQADAPRLAAIGDDLVRELHQVFHRLRDFITRILEVLRHIPDEALQVGLVGESVEARCAVLALVGTERHPRRTGAVVVGDELGVVGRKRHEAALGGEIGEQSRLRQDRDVGGRAGLGVDHHLLFIVFGRRVFDFGAGGLAEILQHHLDVGFVIAAPGSENRKGFALEVDLLEGLEILPVERAFAERVFEIGSKCRCRKGQC